MKSPYVLAGVLVLAGVVVITMDVRGSLVQSSDSLEPTVSSAVNIRAKCDSKKISSENLVSEMYGPIMKLTKNDKINAWKKTGLPKRMWGIWWTSYTNSVNTYLYNAKATERNGHLVTESYLGNSNVWSQPNVQGHRNNVRAAFNYEMDFTKRDGSSEINFATIKSSPNKIHPPWQTNKQLMSILPASVELPGGPLINDFTMAPSTLCPLCADKSEFSLFGSAPAINIFGFGKLTDKSFLSSSCKDVTTAGGNIVKAEDQCWRRWSRFSDSNLKVLGSEFPRGHSLAPANKANSQFTYDVIKIVDEFGDAIQPNFDNWADEIVSKPTFLVQGSGCNKQGTFNSNSDGRGNGQSNRVF